MKGVNSNNYDLSEKLPECVEKLLNEKKYEDAIRLIAQGFDRALSEPSTATHKLLEGVCADDARLARFRTFLTENRLLDNFKEAQLLCGVSAKDDVTKSRYYEQLVALDPKHVDALRHLTYIYRGRAKAEGYYSAIEAAGGTLSEFDKAQRADSTALQEKVTAREKNSEVVALVAAPSSHAGRVRARRESLEVEDGVAKSGCCGLGRK